MCRTRSGWRIGRPAQIAARSDHGYVPSGCPGSSLPQAFRCRSPRRIRAMSAGGSSLYGAGSKAQERPSTARIWAGVSLGFLPSIPPMPARSRLGRRPAPRHMDRGVGADSVRRAGLMGAGLLGVVPSHARSGVAAREVPEWAARRPRRPSQILGRGNPGRVAACCNARCWLWPLPRSSWGCLTRINEAEPAWCVCPRLLPTSDGDSLTWTDHPPR